MVHMVIFALIIAFMKFGPATPSFMENTAQASMAGTMNLNDSGNKSPHIFSAIQNWRQSKIIRTSLGYNPDLFYDLSDNEIRNLFGEPTLVRQDGHARMIQYTHQGCAADFYYMLGKNTKISHYEIRQLGDNTAADCLSELLLNL